MGLIGRVGEMLRFQTEAAAVPVRHAPLTHIAAVQEVAGVELYSRLIGVHTSMTRPVVGS